LMPNSTDCIMHKPDIAAIAAAIALVFSAGAVAAPTMSKAEYKARKERIAAEYKTGKANCDALSGNAKDVCMAEARGKQRVEKAELELDYKPGPKTHYYLTIARANANYAVAREKCDDKTGNDKKVCLSEAKAEQTYAKTDAMRGR